MKFYNIKNLVLIYTYLGRWWIIEVNSCSTKEWWDILLPQINKQKSTIYSWLLGKHQVKIVWKRLKSSLKDKNSLLDLRESDLPYYVQTALSQPKDKTYLQIKLFISNNHFNLKQPIEIAKCLWEYLIIIGFQARLLLMEWDLLQMKKLLSNQLLSLLLLWWIHCHLILN